MLNTKLDIFYKLVWQAAAKVGYSASAITDSVMGLAFPETVRAADVEGASVMLRDGVMLSVRRVLKSCPDDRQIDFGQIAPQFRTIVKKIGLKNVRYFVEGISQHVDVADLIAKPHLLDDARKYMRRKGEECIAEADRLDELYFAVTAP
jgi:hypothetical protein